MFKGWGPFPAVRGVKNQTGAWDHVGASRNPVLSDGTTATETLTEYTVGHSFAYEVTGFTNILGKLVEGVRGEWTFTPDGEGTVIRWTYEFKPRRGRYFLVRRVLVPFWRHYMQAGIEAAARACEQAKYSPRHFYSKAAELVHPMSESGTNRKLRDVRVMSAMRTITDISCYTD